MVGICPFTKVFRSNYTAVLDCSSGIANAFAASHNGDLTSPRLLLLTESFVDATNWHLHNQNPRPVISCLPSLDLVNSLVQRFFLDEVILCFLGRPRVPEAFNLSKKITLLMLLLIFLYPRGASLLVWIAVGSSNQPPWDFLELRRNLSL